MSVCPPLPATRGTNRCPRSRTTRAGPATGWCSTTAWTGRTGREPGRRGTGSAPHTSPAASGGTCPRGAAPEAAPAHPPPIWQKPCQTLSVRSKFFCQIAKIMHSRRSHLLWSHQILAKSNKTYHVPPSSSIEQLTAGVCLLRVSWKQFPETPRPRRSSQRPAFVPRWGRGSGTRGTPPADQGTRPTAFRPVWGWR